MREFIDQAAAKWLDLMPLYDLTADGADWLFTAAIIDLDIILATDVIFRLTVNQLHTIVNIKVMNGTALCFAFQPSTVPNDDLFTTLTAYGATLPAAIKQYFG